MRNKKLVILAHCLLNQNAVLLGWERAPGPFAGIMSLLGEHQVSILQLPCPELAYLGLERPPMTYGEYNTSEYMVHCLQLLKPFALQMKHYLHHDYQLLGILGIEESPSCDSFKSRGVFMNALRVSVNALKSEVYEKTPKLDLPENLEEGGYDAYLKKLKELLAGEVGA